MKRKFLAVGLAAAAVVSITCGYMTTAMAAGPVNQTEDEDACDLQDIMESIEDEALRESPASPGRTVRFSHQRYNAGRNFPDRQFPGRFYYSWEGVRVHKKSGT